MFHWQRGQTQAGKYLCQLVIEPEKVSVSPGNACAQLLCLHLIDHGVLHPTEPGLTLHVSDGHCQLGRVTVPRRTNLGEGRGGGKDEEIKA